ncbi:aminopeptidase 1D, mitochondrial [Seminavis robusta]|uniref:Aminopeptidase 1D, mitochondrial n=1 Tax=Seminavis robusta TaxID=568900 RepID=A0A9N8HC93_9STRA|nr:aminopeptidase 1D, mitochondrial [Seminavis robusta]|eukprot:Sro371_g128660.1 aminopeptidase 1D, mitochondrial (387) ;mRNA; r:68921-70171
MPRPPSSLGRLLLSDNPSRRILRLPLTTTTTRRKRPSNEPWSTRIMAMSSTPVASSATSSSAVSLFPTQPVDQRYTISETRTVPSHIVRPPYAETGKVPSSFFPERVLIHDDASIQRMRAAAQLARRTLDLACAQAKPGLTTDDLDDMVHSAIIEKGAYPSPLNYAGFPKSLCSSVNEVICHGIPSTSRELQLGDVVSFDVSCYLNGVHGDNCATVIVGDEDDTTGDDDKNTPCDWRGVPYKANFDSDQEKEHLEQARNLVLSTRDALYAAIEMCRPGNCLSDVGAAIHHVADTTGYSTVQKYRGHGIGHQFHCAPYVKHFRNRDRLELQPGMIFTIEPMFTMGSEECFEWEDDWTVATVDGSLAAQFEHTILITRDGPPEILTLP